MLGKKIIKVGLRWLVWSKNALHFTIKILSNVSYPVIVAYS